MSTFEQIANGETAANTDFDMEAVNDRVNEWIMNADHDPTMAEMYGMVVGLIYGVDFATLIAPAPDYLTYDTLSHVVDYFRSKQGEREALKRIGAVQEPRILEFDEIVDYAKDHVYVYIEDRDYPEDPYLGPAFYLESSRDRVYMITDYGHDHEIMLLKSQYGKTWRCWTDVPSDELMDANPMNNKIDYGNAYFHLPGFESLDS